MSLDTATSDGPIVLSDYCKQEWSISGIIGGRKKWKCSGQEFPSFCFFSPEDARELHGVNQIIHTQKPASKRVSHGTARCGNGTLDRPLHSHANSFQFSKVK